MNVCDTLYHGDTLTCQTKYNYVKGKIAMALTQSYIINPINLTLRSKVNIKVMNAHNTSSHGDRLIC